MDLLIRSVCRICLENEEDHTDLFSETAEANDLLKKIKICFKIILTADHGLPSVICKKCVNELKIANNFRIKCVTIDKRFKLYCENMEKSSALNQIEDTFEHEFSSTHDRTMVAVQETSPQMTIQKCDQCNKVLKSKKSLMKHVASMHVNRRHIGKVTGYGAVRRYHCTVCSYSTPHSQTLVNHMRRHSGDRPFKCECGKSFTQASSLAAHCKTHTNITNYICSQCGKQFKHAFSLKTHLNVHKEGTFNCNVCSKLLKSKDALHAHLRRHYKGFNYNCEDCGNTFITSAELKNHKAKHSSKREIKCNFCEYCSNTKKSMAIHLKRHMGDKSHTCNYCIKSFITQSDLKRHMRVHTKEKPFVCSTCTQRFTYSSSLNKHMLTVHGVQYKWGDIKWKESRLKLIKK